MEVQVQILVRPVRIVSATPQILDLSLEKLVTKTLPIELTLTGDPAIGYKVNGTALDPAEGVISGPESLVAQVKHIIAMVDLNNTRQSIAISVPIEINNESGEAVNGITVQPDSVQAKVELIQQGGYRDLAVKVVTVGQPAGGYRLKNVTLSPLIVTVYSEDLSLIKSLPGYVETIPLDLSGASSNIDTHLSLKLPEGVQLVGDQTVSIQIEIIPIEGSLTVANHPVEVIGLDPSLKVQVSPTLVDVILSGPLPMLNALQTTDVHVRIDVTGLAPGTYHLVPNVIITNDQVVVQSILPGTIEVVITSAVTPTPVR